MLLRILRPYLDFEKSKDYEVATEAAKYMISMRIAKEVVNLDELTNDEINSTPAEDFALTAAEKEAAEKEAAEKEAAEKEAASAVKKPAKVKTNKLKVDAVDSEDDILGFNS